MNVIAEVLLPIPLNRPFSYLLKEGSECGVGSLVSVQFRNRQLTGLVIEINSAIDSKRPLKTIDHIMPWKLHGKLISFIEKVAEYTITPRGLVLKMCISSMPRADAESNRVKQLVKPWEVELNETQQQAVDVLIASIGHKQVILLEGVTGAGKTEVYSQMIHRIIDNGAQVLLLMPEILLATHITQRLSARFGFKVVEWHSELSPKQRKAYYCDVISGRAKLVIAARSGLFLPFPNLGAIVVDEEHDSSYKQEEIVIYNARDMAVLRGKIEGCPVVLCSATPSIETIYNVELGKYKKVHLPSRFGKAAMPEIRVVDMKQEALLKGKFISPTLLVEIKRTVDDGNQVLLYLNRRGYAPLTMCASCGHKLECPNCSTTLVEHRHNHKTQCHYCGFCSPTTLNCSKCGAEDKMTTYGLGVEKLAEELAEEIAGVRIALFTSDHINSKKLAANMIKEIEARNIDVIIGTQMTAKGLHFPKLQLVGIVEADAGLIGGDIRGIERTYQVLQQVSGRAGREQEKGLVILQTYEPESIVIKHLLQADSKQFILQEMNDRLEAWSPPYSKLIMVQLSSSNEIQLLESVNNLARMAPSLDNVMIIGPAPAPMYIIGKRYRYRFIIKSTKQANLGQALQAWIDNSQLPRNVRVKINVDPYSFL
jgi:primosomal protein N' (replication factor Y)